MANSPAISGRRNHHHPHNLNLLEVTIISAQDLPHLAASRPTYAVAWIHSPDRVSTTVSRSGDGGPHHAWNDKIVFRVDDAFLRSETAAITIHLYAKRGNLAGFLRLSDSLLGTARVVVSAVNPSASTSFVALQVRRPKTLKPEGIINLGVTLFRAPSLHFDPRAPSTFAYRAKTKRGEMRSGSMVGQSSGRGEREREILEWKLRKWRSDLSPIQDVSDRGSSPSLTSDSKKEDSLQGFEEEGSGETLRASSEDVYPTISPRIEPKALPTPRRRRRRWMLCCFHGGE